MKIYLIGSLKNVHIPNIGKGLRDLGHDVVDDWHAAGPDADKQWQRYHQQRGDSYYEALRLGRFGTLGYRFDMHHLAGADEVVLILPGGKSAHLEFGWSCRDRPGSIFFDHEPPDWDLMYKMAFDSGGDIFFDEEKLLRHFTGRQI